MSEVHRFTTKYVSVEDRIRLSLELKSGEVQVLWLTRRLLNLLVPRLLERLGHVPEARQEPVAAAVSAPKKADVVQRFSQQAAVGSIERQPPVKPGPETPQRGVATVVTEVDIRTGPTSVVLDFKGGAEPLQSLPFGEESLRQWLGVVHQQYLAGGWNEDFWPGWMDSSAEMDISRHLN